jgi:hypothetical protein
VPINLRITIALIDQTAGFEVTPDRVRLGDLADFSADDAGQWVQVERYMRGEIQVMGGVTKSNVHINQH